MRFSRKASFFFGVFILILAAILLFLASVYTQEVKAPDGVSSGKPQPPKDSIVNFYCPREGVATSGQPTSEGMEWIAKQGYKAVINFRTEAEDVDIKAEAEHAKKLGMNYIHIPVSLATLGDDKVEAFMAAMNDPKNHPVYIHCMSANRVGAFWMIYLVQKDGYSLEKAHEEAKKVGLRNRRLTEFANDYLFRHGVKP